jgi:carbonic anhydrase/acetyltransferase-like protein (isoleucine patch superfamily)
MAIYRYGEKEPRIGRECFVADSAQLIGHVEIGDGCYIGHNAVLRGDYGGMRIGEGSAIEEGAVLHVPPGTIMQLGCRVTVGHGAVVHGLTIGDDVVIGMGAVVSWGCELGDFSIVAEGAVLPTGTKIPAGKLVVGVPARIHGDVTETNREFWTWGKQLYRDLARDMPSKLVRIG